MNNDIFLVTMGARISTRRKQLHITQEQLAEKIGISVQSISCIELGKKAVRPENLAKLCACLNISADYILFGPQNNASELVTQISLLAPEQYEVISNLVDLFIKTNSD